MAGLFELVRPKDGCFWLSYRIEKREAISIFKINTNIRWADLEEPPCPPVYIRPPDFHFLVSPRSMWFSTGKHTGYTDRIELFKDTIRVYFKKKGDKWILKDKYIPMVEKEY
nr:MAG TPA: hypothetical protein [Caudoviricetes sp.]